MGLGVSKRVAACFQVLVKYMYLERRGGVETRVSHNGPCSSSAMQLLA